MRLTREIANNITEKMMAAIPYNINIMDEDGIIIASGDKKRIGTIHMGAIEAINKRTIVSVSDHSSSIKPGVNMPIMFQDKIIGVIGITGELDIVRPFASLVKGSAELLVSQEYRFQERRVQEKIREEFLFQWIYKRNAYHHDFISQGRDLEIDVTKPRKALFVEGVDKNKLKLRYVNKEEYVVSLGQNTTIILLLGTNDTLGRARKIVDNMAVKSALGNEHLIIRNSFREARKALLIANKLGIKENVIEFSKVCYIDKITKVEEDHKLLEILYTLEETEKGMDLIDTLGSYIFNDGEMAKVANQLHIHRNSLGYRISKIEEITGLNPRNYRDLYQLMTSYIQYKMKTK